MPKLIRITTIPLSLRHLIADQMRYMQEQGFDVLMVSADGPEREAVIENEGCPHIIVPMTRAITPLHDLRCLGQLIQLFRKERPDIVHTHTPKAGLLGMLAALLAGVPVRIHTVAGLPLMTSAGFKRRLLSWTEQLTYAFAQQVWPNSRSLYDYITEQGMASEHKLDIIGRGSSNGIDLGRYSPGAIDEERLNKIKRELNYDPDRRYIVAIGRVVRDKGIIELIDVFTKLHASGEPLHLVLLGPLERERTAEELPAGTVRQIGSHPAITHIDWSDEVEYYLHLADLFIHASHREGFPNVVLQAGAMQCPIVCSAIPGNVDIVTDRATGLLFEAGNAEELEERLVYALNHPERMKKMAKRLRNRIEENFKRERIHEALLERYKELLETG